MGGSSTWLIYLMNSTWPVTTAERESLIRCDEVIDCEVDLSPREWGGCVGGEDAMGRVGDNHVYHQETQRHQ